jgi:hypothetical protein
MSEPPPTEEAGTGQAGRRWRCPATDRKSGSVQHTSRHSGGHLAEGGSATEAWALHQGGRERAPSPTTYTYHSALLYMIP